MMSAIITGILSPLVTFGLDSRRFVREDLARCELQDPFVAVDGGCASPARTFIANSH